MKEIDLNIKSLPEHVRYSLGREEYNAEKKFGKNNYEEFGLYIDHTYDSRFYFSKADVAKLDDGLVWIAKKLNISSKRDDVFNHFCEKYKKYVLDEWKKFSIPGKTSKEYNRDDWSVWDKNRVSIFERCRKGVLTEVNESLSDSKLEDMYKRFIYAVLYYKVGRYIQDMEGD